MQIFDSIDSLQTWLKEIQKADKSIGFVPTMGALHEGHITLVNQSNQDNDITVCSVFVNPTQFNNPEDLDKYPRDIKKDLKLLEAANCDVVFLPTVAAMYPDGEKSEDFEFGGLENQMEGKYRPGHFDGVATIVSRFFDIVKPTKAYFGEKDFQQLRIIQELVKQKDYHIQIIPMPIARERSGLALSSRNTRLTPTYKEAAPEIFRILNLIKDWKNDFSVNQTIIKVEEEFLKTPFELEYILICDELSLEPISNWDQSENIRAFIAAYAGDVRLIDNLKIK
ncbi:pantoate--beta-alanine ligase [Flavobacteriaceae bacterium Ap0902]|nr:pantoate--beta-alanine ligase [Flavobacteriaceae bacterium Ap0902]